MCSAPGDVRFGPEAEYSIISFSFGEPKEVALEGVIYKVGSGLRKMVYVLIKHIIIFEWSASCLVTEDIEHVDITDIWKTVRHSF